MREQAATKRVQVRRLALAWVSLLTLGLAVYVTCPPTVDTQAVAAVHDHADHRSGSALGQPADDCHHDKSDQAPAGAIVVPRTGHATHLVLAATEVGSATHGPVREARSVPPDRRASPPPLTHVCVLRI